MASEAIQSIIETLKGLTVLELSELVHAVEDEFGVSAAAAVAVAAGPAETVTVEVEQTEFDVVLAEIGQSKLAVIKVVKEITGNSLPDSKKLVDGAPSTIKEKVSRDDADSMKAKLEEAGAKVEIK